MSQAKEKMINHMKDYYPNIYSACSNNGKLDNMEVWKRIDKEIKESKSHHCGMDMSGFKSILATIKLELLVMSGDYEDAKLYDYQWEKVVKMLSDGIERVDKLPPYTQSKINQMNADIKACCSQVSA